MGRFLIRDLVLFSFCATALTSQHSLTVESFLRRVLFQCAVSFSVRRAQFTCLELFKAFEKISSADLMGNKLSVVSGLELTRALPKFFGPVKRIFLDIFPGPMRCTNLEVTTFAYYLLFDNWRIFVSHHGSVRFSGLDKALCGVLRGSHCIW